MKKAFSKSWEFACVPIVFLCGHLIFAAVSLICSHIGIYFGVPARFVLTLLIWLTGMFLLRRMPVRTLAVSSAVVCCISLAYNLLLIYRFWFGNTENNSLLIMQKIPGVFVTLPNNIVFPVAGFFSADSSLVSAIIFSVIEIFLPMTYAFSGVFNRASVLPGRKKEREAAE